MRFNSIPDIIAHIRGKFPQMVYVGKEYSIADLIEDLERLSNEMDAEIARTAAVLDKITGYTPDWCACHARHSAGTGCPGIAKCLNMAPEKLPPPPPRRTPLIYSIRKGA